MVITADVVGFTTLCGSMILILGFVIKQNGKNEEGRKSIYRRLDNDRTFTENTYVRKDIHDTKYETMERDVTEIKCDVKKLLTKNNIQ